MPNYEKMYFHLFHAVNDAIEEMNCCNYGIATERLIHAQLTCEEMFLQDLDGREDGREASSNRNANSGIVLLP
ncbi:MAG: hypothetical protein ACI4V3_07565 [Faecousia sp.]